MSLDDDVVRTPTEIIRCVYMARLMERAGNREAAGRWQAKVDRWLKRFTAMPHCNQDVPNIVSWPIERADNPSQDQLLP